jgi:hypothetical protein
VRFVTALLAAWGLLGCGGVPSHASSTFEANDDGWIIGNNGASSTKPTLEREGGNPSGNICGKDVDEGDIWYFSAPPKYLGNASASYGKRLTFDLKQGADFSQIHGRDVILNGGGLSLTLAMAFTPRRDWTPYAFSLDELGGWTVDDQTGRGPPATAEQLQQVLATLTSLRIRGEFFDGLGDTACLDNVYFGRE